VGDERGGSRRREVCCYISPILGVGGVRGGGRRACSQKKSWNRVESTRENNGGGTEVR